MKIEIILLILGSLILFIIGAGIYYQKYFKIKYNKIKLY